METNKRLTKLLYLRARYTGALRRYLWNRYWKGALLRYPLNRYLKGIKICKPPIFIVGCPHSGTSILLAILGSHSRIYSIPFESRLAYIIKPKLLLRGFDILAISSGKYRWVEKTPYHITRIEKLLDLCPDAKILLIIRDGRDVACSMRDRTGSIEFGIKAWTNYNRQGETFHKHPNVHILKYEQLVESFEASLSDIVSFIGEYYESEMREYYKIPKYFNLANEIRRPPDAFGANHIVNRNWQINQPFFDGRGKWIQMTDEEKRIVKDQANEMLVEYGYVSGHDW